MMRVTIVVTHLLGTGHLARALTLGRAFVAAGDQVTLLSGGVAVPHFDSTGIDLIQLPPLRSNGTDFATLLTDKGETAKPEYLARRQAILLDHATASAPDVVITELFPFGRRVLKAEFQALLDAVADLPDRPLILSSVRDILAPPSKPSKVTLAEDLIDRFYDAVLVHSDPAIVPLDRSWPVSDQLRPKLCYTGFVAPQPPPLDVAPRPEIVVSAGGGTDIGGAVFNAACAAARADRDHTWRLRVGGEAHRRKALAATAPPNMSVEPPQPDFRAVLARAAVSVSMCGYNTALDVLQTGVPAVFIPFDDGAEVEQALRADALAALPSIAVIRQAELTGAALAEAVHTLAQGDRRAPKTDGMDGAAQSVRRVHQLKAGGMDAK
ncbi:MAG: glycosyltransferase [Pseudomonadota bacterium]